MDIIIICILNSRIVGDAGGQCSGIGPRSTGPCVDALAGMSLAFAIGAIPPSSQLRVVSGIKDN
ncbi:hypothetical protein [Qipengyuania sp.]|uniref:hypothetical protein n=1 Tax=Qipengyuania sp. TaxID=2004515 RepID=UPI0035C83AE1